MTIVLADDHPIVRQGLRAVLEAEPDFQLVGEASDGLEATHLVERLRPDVLVIDLVMPGCNGLEATRRVSQRYPETRVLILSMHASAAYVLEALRHGAVGYLLKDTGVAELVQAIQQVAAGQRCLSHQVSEREIDAYMEKAKDSPMDIYDTLTTREREVLQLTAEGHSNSEIASRLFISPRTAETQRTNLLRRLELRTHTDLVRYALRRGIIPVESCPVADEELALLLPPDCRPTLTPLIPGEEKLRASDERNP